MELLPNPWSEPEQFDRFGLAGVTFVGVVDLDAGALLKKKSDHRRARGRSRLPWTRASCWIFLICCFFIHESQQYLTVVIIIGVITQSNAFVSTFFDNIIIIVV